MKFKYLLYFLLVVALTLLLTEGILRLLFPLYYPDDYRIYRYDPAAGYQLKSSLHSFRTTDYQAEIITNRYGTVNFQPNFKGYKSLVFALGDSFTQGIGVPADASFPFQLDLLLNVRDDRYHMDYGVVNLGVAGYGPQQEIVRLKEYAQKIGIPRYVLLLVCDNDVGDDRDFAAGAIHNKLVEGNPRFNPLLVRSWLWLKFDTEIGKRLAFMAKIRRRRQNEAPRLKANPQKANPQKTAPQNNAEMLVGDYQALMNYCQRTNATLILSWMPAYLSDQMSPEYRWLRDYCRRQHIAFADWFPVFQSIRKQIPNPPFANHHSAGHCRTWVYGLVARSFAQQIRLHSVAAGP
jgi:lysophospholipase L1-like esterase